MNTFTATIKNIERLKNSNNGNPRYVITFDDYSRYETKPDIADAYGISNSWIDNETLVETGTCFERHGLDVRGKTVIIGISLC